MRQPPRGTFLSVRPFPATRALRLRGREGREEGRPAGGRDVGFKEGKSAGEEMGKLDG